MAKASLCGEYPVSLYVSDKVRPPKRLMQCDSAQEPASGLNTCRETHIVARIAIQPNRHLIG